MLPRLALLIVLATGAAAHASEPRQPDGAKPATPAPTSASGAEKATPGIDPAEIRKLFTERLAAVPLASCDVFEVNAPIVEEIPRSSPVFRMSTKLFYMPNLGAMAAIRQRVAYLRPGDKVKAPFDPKLTYDALLTNRMDYPEFADGKGAGDYVRIAAMGEEDRLQFLRQCGFLAACTCLQDGMTPATQMARAVAVQLGKFEPLVAHYVAQTFKESAQLIDEVQREEIYQGLIGELSNNHALATRLVDVVVARLAAATDTRIATLLAAKIANDDRLRQSLKGIFDSLLR